MPADHQPHFRQALDYAKASPFAEGKSRKTFSPDHFQSLALLAIAEAIHRLADVISQRSD